MTVTGMLIATILKVPSTAHVTMVTMGMEPTAVSIYHPSSFFAVSHSSPTGSLVLLQPVAINYLLSPMFSLL